MSSGARDFAVRFDGAEVRYVDSNLDDESSSFDDHGIRHCRNPLFANEQTSTNGPEKSEERS